MRKSNIKKKEIKAKENESLVKILAARKTIATLLEANITFKLIAIAKNIPEMNFENLDYLKRNFLDELNKEELIEVLKEIVDLKESKIKNHEKLTEFIEVFVTENKIKEYLKNYNPTTFTINKLNEAHKVVFENNGY